MLASGVWCLEGCSDIVALRNGGGRRLVSWLNADPAHQPLISSLPTTYSGRQSVLCLLVRLAPCLPSASSFPRSAVSRSGKLVNIPSTPSPSSAAICQVSLTVYGCRSRQRACAASTSAASTENPDGPMPAAYLLT